MFFCSKTEAVVLGTAFTLRTVDISGGVSVSGISVQFSDKVKLPGVELDQALTIDRHVSSIYTRVHYATSDHV